MRREKVRALVAVSMNGMAFVVATDSEMLAFDVQEISASCDDIGIAIAGEGIRLWEGEATYFRYGLDDDGGTTYAGKCRPVTMDELPALLAMKPPGDAIDEPAGRILASHSVTGKLFRIGESEDRVRPGDAVWTDINHISAETAAPAVRTVAVRGVVTENGETLVSGAVIVDGETLDLGEMLVPLHQCRLTKD